MKRLHKKAKITGGDRQRLELKFSQMLLKECARLRAELFRRDVEAGLYDYARGM